MNLTAAIITHNRLERLKKAIASVENQTHLPNELIIVDDNSSDGTKEFCEKLTLSIPVFYLRNEENRGPGACRNRAIEQAKGGYIAFLDDDDEWERDKLRIQKEYAQKEFDLIYTAVRVNNGQRVYFHRPFPVCFGNFAGITSSMMINLVLLRKIGGFDIALAPIEDYELVIRLVRNKAKVKGIKTPLVKYYLSDSGNISGASDKFLTAARHLLSQTPLLLKPLQFIGLARIFAQKMIKSREFRRGFLKRGSR